VLVSSHLLSEVAQSVDDVVVISHGVLKANGPLEHVLGSPEGPVTRVRAADQDRLAALLNERGAAAEADGAGALTVRTTPDVVGDVAADHSIALRELVPVSRSLEEAFFALTGEEG
jgi:ABC-2 type transport system ATP-binding protein